MQYASSPGPPDFARVLATGDPKWATRAPIRNARRRNNHIHAPPSLYAGARRRLGEPTLNELHGSIDEYFEYVDTDFQCNVTVLPVNDERITWHYDTTARQCARPYISDAGPPPRSNIVKVSRRHGRPTMTYVVHPAVWAAKQANTREPPGDVVAALNRMQGDERAAEIQALAAGGLVCVYFADATQLD